MNENNRERAKDAARASAPARNVGNNVGESLNLPQQPSADQESYLRSIQQTSGPYDPTIVVGGPQRKST